MKNEKRYRSLAIQILIRELEPGQTLDKIIHPVSGLQANRSIAETLPLKTEIEKVRINLCVAGTIEPVI